MMRILCVFVLGLLCAFTLQSGVARAQVELGYHHRFETRWGEMQVVGGDVDQQLWFDGEFLPLPIQPRYWIHGAYGLADEAFDWVLVSHHHGGNSCGGAYHIIRASGDGLLVSPEIGVCALPVLDVRVAAGVIEIDLVNTDVAIDRETFAFDGVTLTVVEDRQVGQGPSQADPRQWVGQHPYRIFEDPAERARFLEIMDEAQLQELSVRIGPANSVIERGGWVLGAGCMAHNCGASRGVWGIRVADGEVAAASMDAGSGRRIYGTVASDPAFQAWIAENAP